MSRIFNASKKAAKNQKNSVYHPPENKRGQVMLEFTFCVIIVLLMIYGVTKIFIWSGREYAGRSKGHDETLVRSINPDYGDINEGPKQQIDPYFYTPVKMNAIWGGN